MKILHIGKFFPVYGGVEKVMYDLCDGLSDRDIQSDFLGVNADVKTTNIVHINKYFTVFAMSYFAKVASTYLSFSMISKLRKIKSNYDIIHIHHPDPMACLSLYLSGYKGIVICHWHSDIVKQKTILKFYKPLQTWMLRRASVIVGTSQTYLDNSPFLNGFKSKFKVVPIGIPPVQKTISDVTLKKIQSIANGRKIVFSLGRLIYYKGYRYLIEASKYLNDNFCVIIGGKGPLKDELEKMIKANNLESKVFLVGRIEDDDLSTYFSNCNAFCLPSTEKSEAFGIVQIEAMAYGKPIVATKIKGSGVDWVNQDGYSGFNAEIENSKDLAEKIDKVFESDQVYSKLSTQALNRYQELFTQAAMVDKMKTIYKAVL
jgi:glycosyltransferase involved in cell wall biosynthesis